MLDTERRCPNCGSGNTFTVLRLRNARGKVTSVTFRCVDCLHRWRVQGKPVQPHS
jgi:DNA-directed RNA polymerase subunit M/transcription elongation factor TFIIS